MVKVFVYLLYRTVCFAIYVNMVLSYGCMYMMLWVQMVALECSRTSVLVSIVSHEHSHLCVNNVYVMYRTCVYGAVILMHACT